MRRLNQVLLVGAGGAVGALVRWGLLELIATDGSFPWATLVANVCGCGLLGIVTVRSMPERTRWLLGAGFCGGLTTMSTFAVEVVQLLEDTTLSGVLYLLASLGAGIVAFTYGRRAGEETS